MNWILILLGVLTSLIGLWNLIVGSFIWGTLFIIGGIWSIWLGTYYIIQEKKESATKEGKKEAEPQETPEFTGIPIDEGVLTQDLFEVDAYTSQLINNDRPASDLTELEREPENSFDENTDVRDIPTEALPSIVIVEEDSEPKQDETSSEPIVEAEKVDSENRTEETQPDPSNETADPQEEVISSEPEDIQD